MNFGFYFSSNTPINAIKFAETADCHTIDIDDLFLFGNLFCLLSHFSYSLKHTRLYLEDGEVRRSKVP